MFDMSDGVVIFFFFSEIFLPFLLRNVNESETH